MIVRLLPVLILLGMMSLSVGCGQKPTAQRDAALDAALEALEAGDTREALKQIDAAIQLDPKAPHLHQMRGSVLYMSKQYGNAAEAYQRAFDLNKNSAEARLGSGLALMRLGRGTQSSGHLKEAERLFQYRADNPPDPERFSEEKVNTHILHAKMHLALITAARGEKADALQQVHELATEFPDWNDADAWVTVIENDRFDVLLSGDVDG